MNTQTQPTPPNTTPTPRRRMRRTGRARCPQRAASTAAPSLDENCKMLDAQCSMIPSNPSTPSASSTSSAPSALRTETKTKRHRARPFQPPPEFAHLRLDQLEFIHDLFRDSTLADVQQQLYTDLGSRLSIATLHRYRAQLDLAEHLQISSDTASAIDHLRDLYAARATSLDPAGLQVIRQRALELAAAPNTSPSLLKDLHRIFTY